MNLKYCSILFFTLFLYLQVFCEDNDNTEVCSYLEAIQGKLNCRRDEPSKALYVNCEYVHFINEESSCARISGSSLFGIDDVEKINCDQIPENNTVCIFGKLNHNTISVLSTTTTTTTQPATTTQVKTTEVSMNTVNREGLDAHNYYRKKHGVDPLKYSPFLAKYAQEWADDLASESITNHILQNIYGQNIAEVSFGNSIDGEEATDQWYSEISNYNFHTGARRWFSGDITHFAQVVWADTKEIGLGIARSRSGKTYIVANYYPPGNISKKYIENVFPKRN